LKKKEPVKSKMLQKEDQIEQNLRLLEERVLHRVERARLLKELEIELAGIEAMVKSKEEELAQIQSQKQ
jgi:DNA-binding transcriptional MerR regulator